MFGNIQKRAYYHTQYPGGKYIFSRTSIRELIELVMNEGYDPRELTFMHNTYLLDIAEDGDGPGNASVRGWETGEVPAETVLEELDKMFFGCVDEECIYAVLRGPRKDGDT